MLLYCSSVDYRFTAPVRGLYWFTVSIAGQPGAQVNLAVDGVTMVKAKCTSSGGDAVSATLMLEAGSRVHCMKRDAGDVLYEADPEFESSFNVFAGFLYAQL